MLMDVGSIRTTNQMVDLQLKLLYQGPGTKKILEIIAKLSNMLPNKHKTSSPGCASPGCASTEIIDLDRGRVWKGDAQAALGNSSSPLNKQHLQGLPLFY